MATSEGEGRVRLGKNKTQFHLGMTPRGESMSLTPRAGEEASRACQAFDLQGLVCRRVCKEGLVMQRQGF